MITITKKGNFVIPQNECFIGHAGDNLNTTKYFFVEEITDISLIYRMYLQFDDGTCNYFLLESKVTDGGTELVWNVTNDQIFKSGIVKIQIKASNDSGEVFHSQITTMLVQTSIEFSDYFTQKENSEFLHYEETLNQLRTEITEAVETVISAVEQAEAILSKIQAENLADEPTEGDDTAITSGGVYTALQSKLTYKGVYTIMTAAQLDNYLSTSTVYDVTIIKGIIPAITATTACKIMNIGRNQFIYTDNGRVYKRNTLNSEDFYQVGFNEADIIALITANTAT